MAITPYLLVVNTDVKASTLAEFVALAKSQRGKLNYASAGSGTTTHLAMEMLKEASGIDVVHVPFKGNAPAELAVHVYAVVPASQALFYWKPRWEPPDYAYPWQGLGPLGSHPFALTFDGDRIWTANSIEGSISIIPVIDSIPSASVTVVPGFTAPTDVIFDGVNVWTTEGGTSNKLRKLNANGSIAQTVAVGAQPAYMVYDGANIWVPNHLGHSITVVQASTGAVVATIATNAANRLSGPLQAAFDGERILVTNQGNDSVTLFRAADLSLIGNVQLAAGSAPFGACSDGINFWVTLRGTKQLLRL